MKAYKGFDKDLKCRDLQYEVGGDYETDRADLCKAGFHACKNPLDCMRYYSPNDGCVYHEVKVSGEIQRSDIDSKIAATRIKIGAKMSIADIVKGAIDFVFRRTRPTLGEGEHAATSRKGVHAATSGTCANAATSGDEAYAATSGDFSYAATSGNFSYAMTSGRYAHAVTSGYGANAVSSGIDARAMTSGHNAHAMTSGDDAHAMTSGRCAHAVTSGRYAHAVTSGTCANAATSGAYANAVTLESGTRAEVKGSDSIAAVLGYGCRARGAMGCWLVLTERGIDGRILDVRAVKVDGEKVKSDTWYELCDGDVVESRYDKFHEVWGNDAQGKVKEK